MKRIVSVLLILLLLSSVGCSTDKPSPASYPDSAAVEPVALGFDVPEVNSYDDFVYTLSAALLDGTANHNLSPLSVYIALAMAAEGANGQTLADLLNLLGCSDLDALHTSTGNMITKLSRKTETGEIALCNSLWMSDVFPLSESYRNSLAELYQANAETVPFGTEAAGKRIAGWIADKTNGLITPAPDAMQFDALTLAVLLNTVYFRDQWAWRFYESENRPGTFTDPNGTETDVDFMHRLIKDSHIERGDGFLRYSIRFESRGYMTFVLPDEGIALDTLLGTPEKLRALLEDGERMDADVDLLLPKYSISDQFELADVLCSLGLTDAFTNNADFSGMSDMQPRLDRVFQKTVLELNELGVEAAAYTSIDAPAEAAPWEAEPTPLPLIEFHLDRPFLFILYAGSIPLFIGTVTNPSAGE